MDILYRVIPVDPYCQISQTLLQTCAADLAAKVSCDAIEISCGEVPAFVDCGENLEQIICPVCGAELSFDWWGEAMNTAAADDFASLETVTPCCGSSVSLNDLDYRYPCGFSCCGIDLLNPADDLSISLIQSVQKLLGVEVRIIKAHI